MTTQMQAVKDREPALQVMSLAPEVKLTNNRPYLRFGIRCVESQLMDSLRRLSLSLMFREIVSMERETRKQSTPLNSVDCSQKRPVRLKSCRFKSSIVTQTHRKSRETTWERLKLRTKYHPDLRSLLAD